MDTETVAGASSVSSNSARRSASISSQGSSWGDGRFLPGTLLSGRYRIIALLGRGGMGEVYRADDLTLGQPVALKFLPEAASNNERALSRFRNEVRIARQVSHANVCRVYDVGEYDGLTYLSMEYVDGEDLGSLLRRIGRLPADKALEIARKLCAGLAAAHERGVLHRDLKPANIMLDARGHVLITDFGLAALAGQIEAGEVRNGTPAYMAPEQLEGKQVSERSDIYALGLVLYEIFTGRRPFEAETLADMVRAQKEATPTSVTSVVRDLDPAVERVILRCLQPDPAQRPASALAVAAALPGGDPLAAALAAGETPSPQLVAAAGQTTGLSPRVAVACLASVIAVLAGASYLNIREAGLDKLPLQYSPEVLAVKAQETIQRFGYTAPPGDTAYRYSFHNAFTKYVEENDKPQPDWDRVFAGRPSPMTFQYRQSPEPMIPSEIHDDSLLPGIVTLTDPPATLSGMISLEMEPDGRLTSFAALPPQLDASAPAAAPPDWNVLFLAAGLDPAQFQPAAPVWNTLSASDARAAWTGVWPGSKRPLRIEAAAWRGKPVYFNLSGPWTKPARTQPAPATAAERAREILLLALYLSLLVGAVLLARRNIRNGKGDLRGALRLAFAIFCLQMVLWVCCVHFVASLAMIQTFTLAISASLFHSGMIFLVYLAMEPYVRRHWPLTIVSWSRLLAGRIRDPLVARDVLFGVVLGMVWILVIELRNVPLAALGAAPDIGSTDFLLSARSTLAVWLKVLLSSVRETLAFFFLLFALRVMLKKQWLAGAVFVLIFSTEKMLESSHPAVEGPAMAVVFGIAAFALLRFGLVAMATGMLTVDTFSNITIPADFSSWYFGHAAFVVLSILALAVWGFHTSLGGQSIWKTELFE